MDPPLAGQSLSGGSAREFHRRWPRLIAVSCHLSQVTLWPVVARTCDVAAMTHDVAASTGAVDAERPPRELFEYLPMRGVVGHDQRNRRADVQQ
jgi:hypothetical protein